MPSTSITQAKPVELLIREIRGQRVILDADLARLYGVTTARLNQQVYRNRRRFPADFMFQLTNDEFHDLMLQNATSKKGRGGRRKRPYAFTEHGAIQAANVLNSDQAVEMGVFVVRAFVKMRESLGSNQALASKVAELEQALLARLDAHDHLITGIIKQLIHLANPGKKSPKQIGFHVSEKRSTYKTRKKS